MSFCLPADLIGPESRRPWGVGGTEGGLTTQLRPTVPNPALVAKGGSATQLLSTQSVFKGQFKRGNLWSVS